MASSGALHGGARGVRPELLAAARDYWFVALAAILFATPGILALGREVWSTEQGAQGPIILATGLWLLWREARGLSVLPGARRTQIAVAWLAALGALYVFNAIIGKLWQMWLWAYLSLLVAFYAYVGLRAMRRLWFPFLYLAFLIPPPAGIIVPLTRTLKLGVAAAAVTLLSAAGYDVAFNGAQLYIDGYELVVAAACSGLNSLTSLLAIGLFYIFLLHRANWRYAAVLSVAVIPIAIATNIARVVILLLVTHYLGEEASQGILHEAAGMMMFFIALFALIAIDAALSPLRNRLGRAGAGA